MRPLSQTVRLVPLCAGLALAGAIGPAQAAEPAKTLDLTYDAYLGGMHIFTFDVDMTLQPDRYRVEAEGQTEGMVGWMYEWQTRLLAEGLERDGRIEPERYDAESSWQGNQRTVELGFAGDGRYRLERSPSEPDPDIEGGLPEKLPAGTVDPLSLAVAASQALMANGRCDQTVPVFDGQRRYDLTLRHIGEATLPPSDYSIYQGKAVRCGVSINRISGFRKSWKSKRQWDAPSSQPTLWVAAIRPDLPPVPVRYDGAIMLGNIVIHLTKAQVRSAAEEAGAE